MEFVHNGGRYQDITQDLAFSLKGSTFSPVPTMRSVSLFIWLAVVAFERTTAASVGAQQSGSQMVKIECLKGTQVRLGEGPHWDVASQSLFFVDIRSSTMNMYTPATERLISIAPGSVPVTFIVPVKGKKNHFVIGEKLNVTLIHWDTSKNVIVSKEVLATAPDPPTNRFNDAKCDSTGRLWLGTMTDANGDDIINNAGFFYSFTKSEGMKLMLKDVTISNGLAFAADNKKFWYVDSTKYAVDEFNLNVKAGEISDRKVIFDVKKNNISGLPDGMTIDADGNLWVALFGGAKVIQVSPKTGKLLRTIEIPTAHQITSVCFGGPNLDELYVTSADDDVRPEDAAKFKERGHTFKVTGLGVRGLPPAEFDISL